MRRAEYMAEYDRLDTASRRPARRDAGSTWARLVRVLRARSTLLPTLALAGAAVSISVVVAGVVGVGIILAWWLAPTLVGYVILVGDFSYRSHLRLPPRTECRPYIGQDTRSLCGGLWGRFADGLTFGLYDHRRHHVRPGRAASASVRLGED